MPSHNAQHVRRSPRRLSPNDESPTSNRSRREETGGDDRREETGGDGITARKLTELSGDSEMIDLAPELLTKVHTYLGRHNRTVLRNIGRVWQRRGTGNKKEFLFRNLLFLIDAKRAGRDIEKMIRDNRACPSYDDYLKEVEHGTVSFSTCPTESSIRLHLGSVGDPDEIPSRGTQNAELGTNVEASSPHFSVSEFARLFVMLRDDHVSRNALLKLTQDLKRADFEAGRTRESFWKEIESRFNDENLKYFQRFEGAVPEADPSAAPLCFRKFDVLKTQLQNARKIFTSAYANYCQSGQNDPDNWPDFLHKDDRGKFIAASKRCYIIFLVCRLNQRCGQDMFLLSASQKTFSGGDDEGPGDSASTGSSGSKRKRLSAENHQAIMEKRWEGLNAFMRETTKQGSEIQESITSKRHTLVNDFAEVAERDSVLGIVQTAYKRFLEAKEGNQDPKLVGFLKKNYERALSRYSELEEQ